MERKVQKDPTFPPPPTRTASPIINIPHQSGAHVTTDRSTVTRCPLKSVTSIKVYS